MTNNIRFGTIKGPSNDKGPYKLMTVTSEDNEIEGMMFDPSGSAAAPMTDGLVVIIPIAGDEGKHMFLAMPPPADRIDGLKEGEQHTKNHKRGQSVELNDAGDVVMKSPSGIVHINPPE